MADHHLVHNDLKPQNIMLTEDGNIKIVDWGFATILGEEAYSTLSAAVGSNQYIAPEMLSNNRSSLASDLYSLGGVIFAMAFGEAPFANFKNVYAIYNTLAMGQHATIPADKPEYKGIITACWQHDPTRRPTVHAIYKQIGLLRAQLQPKAPPPSHTEIAKTSNKFG